MRLRRERSVQFPENRSEREVRRDLPGEKDACGSRVSGGRIGRWSIFRTFDGSHDPTFAFTPCLRPCAWRYRGYITDCSTRGGMLCSRLSSSRAISPRKFTQTRAFGRGKKGGRELIAATADPLGFGLCSISNSAVYPSLRKNEMPLPHSVYQPDPACVPFPNFFVSPPLFPFALSLSLSRIH